MKTKYFLSVLIVAIVAFTSVGYGNTNAPNVDKESIYSLVDYDVTVVAPEVYLADAHVVNGYNSAFVSFVIFDVNVHTEKANPPTFYGWRSALYEQDGTAHVFKSNSRYTTSTCYDNIPLHNVLYSCNQ